MKSFQILTFFSNVEIFSVYLSNVSFDPFENIFKYRFGQHRIFTKTKNKIKALLHTALGFQFKPTNLVINFAWSWSWILKVILLEIEVLVTFTLKASTKEANISISSKYLTLILWSRLKYLYFVVILSL